MRTVRVLSTMVAIMGLLVASSGVVVAQMDGDADAVYVTAKVTPREAADAGTVSRGVSLYSSRDGVNVQEMDASDPRVSGTATITWNVDVDLATGQGIMWGTVRLENDDGGWEGPWTGMEYEPGEADYFTTSGWLTGDGDYAGYTFYYQNDAFQYDGPTRKFHGIVFKGQPPLPEPAVE